MHFTCKILELTYQFLDFLDFDIIETHPNDSEERKDDLRQIIIKRRQRYQRFEIDGNKKLKAEDSAAPGTYSLHSVCLIFKKFHVKFMWD